jgi:hypothetical protein
MDVSSGRGQRDRLRPWRLARRLVLGQGRPPSPSEVCESSRSTFPDTAQMPDAWPPPRRSRQGRGDARPTRRARGPHRSPLRRGGHHRSWGHPAVEQLVFIAGMVLDTGETCSAAAQSESEAGGISFEGRPDLSEGFVASSGDTVSLEPRIAAACLFNDCDERTVAWALDRLEPQLAGQPPAITSGRRQANQTRDLCRVRARLCGSPRSPAHPRGEMHGIHDVADRTCTVPVASGSFVELVSRVTTHV